MNNEERALAYAQDIARFIRHETVQRPGSEEAFAALHEEMRALFPEVHRVCERVEVDGSLMYRWPGESSDDALLLMSHHDVVAANADEWSCDPFAGEIRDGKLWGRGTLDVKGNLYCIFRAVEELIDEGFTPAHDVYLVTSNCEEIGGNAGVPNYMREHGIKVGLLLDEGSSVQPCGFGDAGGDVAFIATAEKGFMNVRITARGAGGHASAPGVGSPMPRLGALMADIDANGLFDVRIVEPVVTLLDRVAQISSDEEAARLRKVAACEEGWRDVLPGAIREMARTTVAFTMAGGSAAPNILPSEAWAVCNIRIEPGRTVEETFAELKRRCEPYDVELEMLLSNDPSPVSDSANDDFARVERAVHVAYPGVPVMPFLLSGGTDTKHFTGLYRSCLRFTALHIDQQQIGSMHAADENVDLETLPRAVDFFRAVLLDDGAKR